MPRRRTLLACAAAALAGTARAEQPEARVASAFRALAGNGPVAALGREGSLLRERTDGTWVAAAVETDRAGDGLLRVAVLAVQGDEFRMVARGEADPLTIEPPWRTDLALDGADWRVAPDMPLLGVVFGNAYNSTARSSSTRALHLFRQSGTDLIPVFAAMTRQQAYDKDGAETCVERRGFARPGRPGRDAPEAVQRACDARNETDLRWTVAIGAARRQGVSDLLVQQAGRVVSRHRWAVREYAPARFER